MYYAPELIEKNHLGYTAAVDFWQYGNLMYELLVGKAAFSSKSKMERQDKIINLEPNYPDYLSENTVSFLKILLDKNPETRPQDGHVLQSHLFFERINWEMLLARRVRTALNDRYLLQNGMQLRRM